MYPGFRIMGVFLVLFMGVFLFPPQIYPSMPLADSPNQCARIIKGSDTSVFWVAQSKQTEETGLPGCLEVRQKAQEVATKAEEAAEKALRAADNARRAGEALDRAKEAGEATERIKRAAQKALEAAEEAMKAAEEAAKVAEEAARIAEEARAGGCLEAAEKAQAAADKARGAAKQAEGLAQRNTERLRDFRPLFLDAETVESDWYQQEGREKEVSPSQ